MVRHSHTTIDDPRAREDRNWARWRDQSSSPRCGGSVIVQLSHTYTLPGVPVAQAWVDLCFLGGLAHTLLGVGFEANRQTSF